MIIYNIKYNIKKVYKNKDEIIEDIYVFNKYGYIVSEKNMSPYLKKNDVAIFKKFNSNVDKINVGDVAVYIMNNKIVIHRIVGYKNYDGKIEYVTKADNDYYNDLQTLNKDNIIGIVHNKICFVGWILKCIQSLWFTIIIIIFISIAYMYTIKMKQRSLKRRKILKNTIKQNEEVI